MNIKNAIVLVDEIGLQLDSGLAPVNAVIEATKTRIVPVTMASGTTILGMLAVVGRRHVCRYGRDDHGRSVRLDHPDHLRASGDLLYISLRLNRYNEYEKVN